MGLFSATPSATNAQKATKAIGKAIADTQAQASDAISKGAAQEAILDARLQTASTKTDAPKKEQEKQHKWRDPNEDVKFVCQNGKVSCIFCSNMIGDIAVTSTQVMLQDAPYVTTGDRNGAANLLFKGVCNHPKWGSNKPPCASVISLGEWQKTSETYIDDHKALLRKSTITCNVSGQDIKIAHSGQKAVLDEVKPISTQPQITDAYWANETGKISAPHKTTLSEDVPVSVQYGTQVKVVIKTSNMPNGTKLKVTVKANNMPASPVGTTMPLLPHWDEIEVINNKATTPHFYLHLLWCNDAAEQYDYTTYKTTADIAKATAFYVEVIFNGKTSTLPKNQDKYLMPFTYTRNYEEWVGTIQNANKDYQSDLIKGNNKIEAIVDQFISDVANEKKCTVTAHNFAKEFNIEALAKSLWDEAVAQVQSGNLDDRPLYWARIKMQVWLKRHPAFKPGVDYNKDSRIIKGSKLDYIITKFEEKSRNYTGIDFSGANGKKKVLITGFDPYVINPNHPNQQLQGEISRQNPSGITALQFHNYSGNNAFVQVAILPVRYDDFDGGVVENIVSANINTFDFMFTTSLNDKNFDLERFAGKHRGGFLDNRNIGTDDYNDKTRFIQIQDTEEGNEFYETTLPIEKIMVGDLAPTTNKIYFDQSVAMDSSYSVSHPNQTGINTATKISSLSDLTGNSVVGSGGDYLSNEVMYRATRYRDTYNCTQKKMGHIHIGNTLPTNVYLDIIKQIITNATQ